MARLRSSLTFLTTEGYGSPVTSSLLFSVAAKTIATLLTFLVSIFLARQLGPDGYGRYALWLAITMLLATPLQTGVSHLVVRESSRSILDGDGAEFVCVIHWAIKAVLVTAGLVCTLLLVFAFGLELFTSLDALSGTSFLLSSVWLAVFIPLTAIFGSSLRGMGAANLGLLPDQSIRPAAFLLFLLVAAYVFNFDLTAHNSLLVHVLASLVSLGVAMTFYLARKRQAIHPVSSPPSDYDATDVRRRRYATVCLTFGTVALLQLLNSSMDTIMMGVLRTDSETGVYRVMVQIAMLVAFGLVAVNPVLHGRIARLYENGSVAELQSLTTLASRVSLLIAALPVTFIILVADFLILRLYGPEFLDGIPMLFILLAGHLANVAFGPVAALLNMSGHQDTTMKVMLLSATVNLVLMLLLVPTYGGIGAAISTALAILTWNATLWLIVQRRLGIRSGFWARKANR